MLVREILGLAQIILQLKKKNIILDPYTVCSIDPFIDSYMQNNILLYSTGKKIIMDFSEKKHKLAGHENLFIKVPIYFSSLFTPIILLLSLTTLF